MTDYYTLANDTLPSELADAIIFLAGREDFVPLMRYLRKEFNAGRYLDHTVQINAVWQAVLADGVKHMEITQAWADANYWALPDIQSIDN